MKSKKCLFPVNLILLLTLTMSSCSKDTPKEPKFEPAPTTPYYVKYEASGSPYYLESITVATEKGTKIFSGGRTWTQTFGPVWKGFNTMISVESRGSVSVQIYVCREQEPFVIKQTQSGNGNVSASYRIDF